MSDIKWITVSDEKCGMYGINEKYQNMSEEIAKEVSHSVLILMKNTAAVKKVSFDIYIMEYGVEILSRDGRYFLP